jgi:hypothetical protein
MPVPRSASLLSIQSESSRSSPPITVTALAVGRTGTLPNLNAQRHEAALRPGECMVVAIEVRSKLLYQSGLKGRLTRTTDAAQGSLRRRSV